MQSNVFLLTRLKKKVNFVAKILNKYMKRPNCIVFGLGWKKKYDRYERKKMFTVNVHL